MFRSTIEKRLQYLAANAQSSELRSALNMQGAGNGLRASQPQRFPPIEDVIAALDSIALRAIAA